MVVSECGIAAVFVVADVVAAPVHCGKLAVATVCTVYRGQLINDNNKQTVISHRQTLE